MKVLSLFDGMACGMLAMKSAGIEVTDYDAYEIDKYAMQVATHNFPEIREHGDVFKADFTQYKGVDFVVGGSPCFVAGTQVFTSEGMKDIEEVKVGDMVYTHMNRFRMVTATDSKLAKVSELRAQGIPPMLVTDNHPFYVSHMERVWNNDRRCHEREFTQPCWREVGALSKGDFLSSPILTAEENFLGLTEEVCWILGRYVADGHCRKDKRKGRKDSYQYQMILSVGKDKVVSVKDAIKSYNMYCYPHTSSTYRCVISNKELVDLILDNDFGRNAVSKNVPNIILNLPRYLAESFLKGYLSGDGHFSTQWNQWSCTTVSKRLAYSLALLVQKVYGCNASISYRSLEKTHVIEGRTVNQRPQYIITFREGMKKQSVAKRIGDHVFTPFKSRRDAGIEVVYNLSVDEDESYIANNRVVHNCTYWSIAQTKNRETEAHGIGWELFQQYVRAVREAEPRFFVYENNKSMSDAIRKEISETFGFEPICINSALVSAQNRQRLYWVGVRQDDGTYRKADIDQPDDRGILLKDVLDDGWVTDKDKSHAVIGSIARTTHREYFQKSQGQMVAEPVNVTSDGKTHTIKAQYYKNGIANFVTNGGFGATGVAEPVAVDLQVVGRKRNEEGQWERSYEARTDGKSSALTSVESRRMVAEPVAVRCRGRRDADGNGYAKYEARSDSKSNTLDTNTVNGSMVAEPIAIAYRTRVNEDGSKTKRFEANGSKSNCLTTAQGDCMVAEPIRVGSLPRPNGELSTSQAMRVYSDEGKGVGLKACGGGMGGKTGLYAIPICHTIPQEVSVRKYTCNIEDLKTLLRDNKTKSNREIAEALNKPVTMVEHWFRTDNCFSVPDADVWFKLKELLGITSTEFDDFVTVFETREGVFEKSHRCYDSNGKMSTLTTGSSDNIIHPILLNPKNEEGLEPSLQDRIYSADGKSTAVTGGFHPSVCVREVGEPTIQAEGSVGNMYGKGQNGQLFGVNSKTKTLSAGTGQSGSGIGSNNSPKAVLPYPDYKGEPIYEVKDGMISIKNKQYPIKLADGHYIIRKLTVDECKRLQTVPEWYDMTCISNTQAYKCLGNGWTVEVIAHLISGALGTDCKEPLVSAKPYAQTNLDRYIGGC